MNTSPCCCLNSLPPNSSTLDHTTSSSSLLSTKHHFPRKPNEMSSSSSSSSWRSKKLVAIATTIVLNLEIGDITSNINGNSSSYYYSMANEIGIESHQIPKEKKAIARWSEKRSCPPWKMNSLETIVPENLPRPSAHRNWEGVSNPSKSAPLIKFSSIKPSTSCFSM